MSLILLLLLSPLLSTLPNANAYSPPDPDYYAIPPTHLCPPSDPNPCGLTITLPVQINLASHSEEFTIIPCAANSPNPCGDAYSTSLAFCAARSLPAPCAFHLTYNLVENGAPLYIPAALVISSPQTVLDLAESFYDLSRPKTCSTILEKLLAVSQLPPTTLPPLSSLPPTTLAVYEQLASCYQAAESSRGLSLYAELSAYYPPANLVPHINYAIVLSRAGDLPAARAIFRQATAALALSPHVNAAWIHLEFAQAEYEGPDGDPAVALDQVVTALSLFDAPSSEQQNHLHAALLLQGKLLLAASLNDQAAATLTAALALSPLDVEVITSLDHATSPPKTAAPNFVTFASEVTKCELQRLVQSGTFHGVTFDVLGHDVSTASWKNGMKLQLLLQYVTALDPAEMVVVVDGYDVVLAGTPAQFVSKFNQLAKQVDDTPEVVFQADYTFYCPLKNSTASAYYASNYPPAPTVYKYLSSGGIVGKAEDIATLVETVVGRYTNDEWESKSDQSLFIRYLVDGNEKGPGHSPGDVRIVVDHYQSLFSGNGGRVGRDFDVVEGRIHHKVTDTFPVMFHCPGRTKNQREMMKLLNEGWNNHIIDCSN